MNKVEEAGKLEIDFRKIGKVADVCPNVVRVAIRNIYADEVILVAYTKKKAFTISMQKKSLVLWSTSRNELWEKGKTSGETFEIVDAYVNCEQNSLLYRVRPKHGGICHTRNKSDQPRNCFYRKINMNTLELQNMDP